MEQQKNNTHRISIIEGGFMVTVALFYDVIQIFFEWMIIGFLFNWIITIFAALTFFTWFSIKGVNLFSANRAAKRLLPFVISFIIDIIPGSDATILLAFTWTMSTAIIVARVQLEDGHTMFSEKKLSRIAKFVGK